MQAIRNLAIYVALFIGFVCTLAVGFSILLPLAREAGIIRTNDREVQEMVMRGQCHPVGAQPYTIPTPYTTLIATPPSGAYRLWICSRKLEGK